MNKRFFASKEERGIWSVWDSEKKWWASPEARWMPKRDAEQLARKLNAEHSA